MEGLVCPGFQGPQGSGASEHFHLGRLRLSRLPGWPSHPESHRPEGSSCELHGSQPLGEFSVQPSLTDEAMPLPVAFSLSTADNLKLCLLSQYQVVPGVVG